MADEPPTLVPANQAVIEPSVTLHLPFTFNEKQWQPAGGE